VDDHDFVRDSSEDEKNNISSRPHMSQRLNVVGNKPKYSVLVCQTDIVGLVPKRKKVGASAGECERG